MGADDGVETARVTQKIITIPYVASEEWDGAAKWPTPKPEDAACPENSMDFSFLVGIRIDVGRGREWWHETYEMACVDLPSCFDRDVGFQNWPADSRIRKNRRSVRIRRMALTAVSSDSLLNHLTSAHGLAPPSPAPSALQSAVH